MTNAVPRDRVLAGAAAVVVAALVASGIDPFDRGTWFLEVLPVLVALPLLWLTRRRFPLTPLLYGCIFVHALVLIQGGAFTYARVPLGEWLRDAFDLTRNPGSMSGGTRLGFERLRSPLALSLVVENSLR